MKAINLHLNDSVDIREESGRIVIEPIRNEYNLEELLDGITPKNLHSEFSFGPVVGKEAL